MHYTVENKFSRETTFMFQKVISALLYFVMLEVVYYTVEFRYFSYVGYGFSFDEYRFIIGWIIFALGSIMVMSQKDETISTAFYYIIYFLSICPCIVLYQFDCTELWMLLFQMMMLMIIIFSVSCAKRLKRFSIPVRHYIGSGKNSGVENVLIVLVVLFFIYSVLDSGVFSLKVPSFEDVYIVRKNAEFSSFDLLLQTVMCKIVIPMSIAYFIGEKKWLRAFFTAFVQLYIYTITGFKTYLFVMLVAVAFELVRKISLQKLMLLAMPLAMIGGLILFKLSGSLMFAAIVFNRTIYLPARIKWAYFDFFSTHPHTFFADGTLGRIFNVTSPYDKPVVFMIGDLYFDKPEMWTNTGFMADAYANLGWAGGIIIALIMAALVYLMDVSVRFDDKTRGIVVFLLYFIALNDGALITTAVSGGLILAILVFLLVNRRRQSDEA